jgi:hypothetical protein
VFVPWNGGEALREILCEQHEQTVGADHCVRFETLSLQIPMDRYRCHYVKARVSAHRYTDGALSIFHGPRKLADYTPQGKGPPRRIPSSIIRADNLKLQHRTTAKLATAPPLNGRSPRWKRSICRFPGDKSKP